MMEAQRSSEMSDLTRAKRRNIPEDDIRHSHRRENLKSYKSNARGCIHEISLDVTVKIYTQANIL
jgi:hypothetical protein